MINELLLKYLKVSSYTIDSATLHIVAVVKLKQGWWELLQPKECRCSWTISRRNALNSFLGVSSSIVFWVATAYIPQSKILWIGIP